MRKNKRRFIKPCDFNRTLSLAPSVGRVAGNRSISWARLNNAAALTFIELLVVTCILAVVSLAIYGTFNSGVKIWQRINKQAAGEDLAIFLDDFVTDLRNTFVFGDTGLTGEQESLECFTLVNSQRLKNIGPGRVKYFFNSNADTLQREEKDFSCLYSEAGGLIKAALKDVKGARFQYYAYDKQKNEYLWLDDWQSKEEPLPLAVRIELEFTNGSTTSKITRTVTLPAAS